MSTEYQVPSTENREEDAQDASRAPSPLCTPHSALPTPRSVLGTHLMVVGGYALLTLLLTDPLPSRLSTQVIGGGDAWQHIWNLWWVKEALLERHTNPFHTDLLYYPDGVNLYLHTLVPSAGVTGIPLQLLGFNLIATYNIVLLLSLVLAGYGMFLLCHYLTGSRWASFVGGLVFAFSPYHFAHLYGHLNLASLQWIPFYVLALLKAVEEPSGGRWTMSPELAKDGRWSRLPRMPLSALAAGALLALNAYTEWIHAVFLAILTGLLLAWKLLVPSERRVLAERVGWRDGLLRLAAGGGVALLLLLPVLPPTLAEAQRGYAQQPPRETLVYSSDAVLAFTPSELHPVWGDSIKELVSRLEPYTPLKHPSERVVFLGYSVLLLAGYGAWRLWGRDRRVRFWAFAAVATWVLSLGPVLQVLGKSRFTVFEVTVPLPYLILYKLPLFSIMRTPARLTVLTMLALGVLVAFALAFVLSRLGEGRIKPYRNPGLMVAALSVPVLMLFEFLSVPFPTVPPGWGVPIYQRIAQEPGHFALLELPLRPFSDYMAYQTVHGKPIIGGYIARQPPYPLLEEEPAVRYLLNTTPPDSPMADEVAEGRGVEALRELGVKYVIIRWWAFTDEERAAMEAKLRVLLDRPPDFSYERDRVDVWQLMP